MLDLGGGNPGYRSKRGRSGFAVQSGLRNILAIAHASLGGVGCNHAMTGIVEQQILQEVVGFLPTQSFMRLML